MNVMKKLTIAHAQQLVRTHMVVMSVSVKMEMEIAEVYGVLIVTDVLYYVYVFKKVVVYMKIKLTQSMDSTTEEIMSAESVPAL